MAMRAALAAVCAAFILQGCVTARPPDAADLEAVAGLTADELREAIRKPGPECTDRRNAFATATPECRAVLNAWLKRQDARRAALKALQAADEQGPPVPQRITRPAPPARSWRWFWERFEGDPPRRFDRGSIKAVLIVAGGVALLRSLIGDSSAPVIGVGTPAPSCANTQSALGPPPFRLADRCQNSELGGP